MSKVESRSRCASDGIPAARLSYGEQAKSSRKSLKRIGDNRVARLRFAKREVKWAKAIALGRDS
jgi:hypothetical protein